MRIGPRPLRRFGALALLLLFAGGSLPGHLHAAGEDPHPAHSQGHEQGHERGHDPAGHHPPADHAEIDPAEEGHADHGHPAHEHSADPHPDHDHSDHDACPGCLCPAGTAGCLALSTPAAARAQQGGALTTFALPRAEAPHAGTLLLGIFRPPRR